MIQDQTPFHAEKDALYEAGLASRPYQQTDDTLTRVDGQNLSFLIGIFIAITGYVPGTLDDERILAICWSFVFGGGLGMYLLSFLAGFANDLQKPMERVG